MKKIISGLIIGILIASFVTAFAANKIGRAFFNDTIKIIVNGKQLDVNPVTVILEGETNGANYVPARAVAEALGATVEWDGANKKIIITSKDATPTSSSKTQTDTYNIGDSAEAGNYVFTVNSVRESTGNEFIKPKDGNIYYIVDATVENKSSKSVTVSSMLMFKLVDSEGYGYNITFGPETKGQLDGEVGAGRKLRGELVFEIPKDAKGLELEIDQSLWASEGKIIFKLDR